MKGRLCWPAAFGLLAGTNFWLASGWLGAMRNDAAPVVLIVTRSLWHLPQWWIAMTLAALAAARAGRKRLPASGPLVLLSLPLAALALVASPLRYQAAPFVYVFLDLHPWVLGGAILWLAAALAATTSPADPGRAPDVPGWHWAGAVARWVCRLPRRVALEALLAGVLAGASLATSPILRFQSALNGDEPKYVRYMENWYRGRGMDVGSLEPVAELPPGAGPAVFENFRHLSSAAVTAASDLWQDVRRAACLSAEPPPGPATGTEGWFVLGKRGGVYQVHNPGFSFLLFPGYFIDRTFLNWKAEYHPQFPSNLYCSATLILLLYLGWAVATFRLLASATGRAGLSWALTCLVFLSLPVAAFAYQYYPEVAAGFLVTLLARFCLLPAGGGKWQAAGYGLLAGFLPWLHTRFGAISLVAAAIFAFDRRRSPKLVAAFLAAFVLPVAALAGYYYHVTGSIAPWALHRLSAGTVPFDTWRALGDLRHYWLDWGGGLPAHAPVYLLALPGVWLCWRRSRRVAAGLALIVFALAVPAAGHGWTGGGTSPLRLVASVVPLLAVPLAESAARYGRSRWFQAFIVVLGVVSVQNGLTYSAHLFKSEPWLVGPALSGWMSPLLFAERPDASLFAQPAFWWGLASLGLIAFPPLRERFTRPLQVARSGSGQSMSLGARVVVAACCMAGLGCALGAWTGHLTRTAYAMEDDAARDEVIKLASRHRGAFVWSSTGGITDIASLFPNSEGVEFRAEVQPHRVLSGGTVTATLEQTRGRSAWGIARVDFGDQSSPRSRRFVGGFTERHSFAAPGVYTIRFDISLPGGNDVHEQVVVEVQPSEPLPVPAEVMAAVPADLLECPVTVNIEEVSFGAKHLAVEGAVAGGSDGDVLWAWVMAEEQTGQRARLYGGQKGRAEDPPGSFHLAFEPVLPSADKEIIGLVVGVSRAGERGISGRSEVVRLSVPGPLLRIGSDVLERLPAGRR